MGIAILEQLSAETGAVAFILSLCGSGMVSARDRVKDPVSHPIAENNACGSNEDFDASDEETGCHDEDDNFLDVGDSTDTEVMTKKCGRAPPRTTSA